MGHKYLLFKDFIKGLRRRKPPSSKGTTLPPSPTLIRITVLLAALSGGCFFNALPENVGSIGASSNLNIPGLAFSIIPSSLTINVNQTYTFSASKGLSPYTYSVSGSGSIDSNGLYTAPAAAGTDTVTVTDSIGQTASATVSIGVGPVFADSEIYVEATTLRALSATSVDSPLTWQIITGSGTVVSTGATTADFTAAATEEDVTIRATDVNGFYSEITIHVFIRNIVRAPRPPGTADNGNYTTCIIKKSTNRLYCFGSNMYGRLLTGTGLIGDEASDMSTNLRPMNLGAGRTPVSIHQSGQIANATHDAPATCVLLDNGTAKCWGTLSFIGGYPSANSDKNFKKVNSLGDALDIVPIGDGRTIQQISVNSSGGATNEAHACALMDDNNVKCWGSVNNGRLGQQNGAVSIGDQVGELPALPNVVLGTTATYIATGRGGSCAVLTGGTVKCWGDNNDGQLGQGDSVDRGQNVGSMTALAAIPFSTTMSKVYDCYGYFYCGLTTGGGVRCWGDGANGALGRDSAGDIGDDPGEMAALSDINLGFTANNACAGAAHACAISTVGEVKCWGANSSGQLGQGHSSNLGDNPGEMAALTAIDLGTGRHATQISCGGNHTCALLDNGTLKCWGSSSFGLIGTGIATGINIGDSLAEMGDALQAINFGAGRTVSKLSCGHAHACVVLDNGGVKCWGSLSDGALGLGSGVIGVNVGDNIAEMGDGLPYVDLGTGRTALDIDLGYYVSCAVLDNNSVKCWGLNSTGQLGQGHVQNIGDDLGEMGDNLPAIDIP